jgi:hypothetical protein
MTTKRINPLTYEPVVNRRRTARIQIERSPDGGVMVRAPLRPRASVAYAAVSVAFWFAWLLFVASGLRLVRWDWHAVPVPVMLLLSPFACIGAIVGAAFIRKAWLWERRTMRLETVGISPTTVFVDVPGHGRRTGSTWDVPALAFEAPRAALRSVRIDPYPGQAGWSRCILLFVEGHDRVEFCVGRREKEICDTLAVLQDAMQRTSGGSSHEGVAKQAKSGDDCA